MTINELVAKIEQVKEQISNCEYSLNHLQTTTSESYKQVFTSDWEDAGGIPIYKFANQVE